MDLLAGLQAVRAPADDALVHLAFLDLEPREQVGRRLRQLASLLGEATDGEAAGALQALLDSPNWRGHLIAAAGLLLRAPGEALLDALWSRILLGSWVVGPLAAAAFTHDPGFARRAESWIAARYGPPMPPRGGVDGMWNVFSGQTVAVLLAFLGELPGESAWIAEWQARPTVAAALAEAGDAGAKAVRWWAAMTAEVEAAAVPGGARLVAANGEVSDVRDRPDP